MFIVPRVSVRINLTFVILVTILLSWVLSTGIANYLNYLNILAIRQEMLQRPDVYPYPIPEPTFDVEDFLLGRPPKTRGRYFGPPPESGMRPDRPPIGASGSPQLSAPGTRPNRPPVGGPNQPPPENSSPSNLFLWLLPRLLVALGLAVLAGILLGRKFTKPLMHLAKGADAFQSGNFAYRIPSEENNEFGAVASAMNQMAQQVSDQISSLEDDAHRRRQFLADIAHELRSPVTTMCTMAGALKDGLAEEPERREKAVSALVRTSDRMLRLVQDLMELAKLDLNELPLNMRQIDIRELISSAIASFENQASEAGIIIAPLNDSTPVILNVDPDRITQVIDNLLQNSISYAGEGAKITVTIEEGDAVKISIQDTGKGIRSDDLPYIFDSFYRADTARTPGESHSGLGLSIARRLIETHGGELTVESEEGQGTSVTITIPK